MGMRTVYIDDDFKCHVVNDGTMTAVKKDFFDGKCDAFVEGFRCIPKDEYWKRDDGKVFTNQITPWQPYEILAAYQRQYEADNAAMVAAYQEGVDSV